MMNYEEDDKNPLYSEGDKNPLLQPPPDTCSPLALLLASALTRRNLLRIPHPEAKNAIQALLEGSRGIQGVHRGDVLGRRIATQLPNVDPSRTRAVSRNLLMGVPVYD